MTGKIIDLSCGKMWLDDEGIMHLVYSTGVEVTLKEAKEVGSVLHELSQGMKKPYFVDARLLRNINREARVYWQNEEVIQCIRATATLSTPIVKVLGTIYSNLNKPPFEIKYFSSEADALEWLRGFKE